MNAKEFSLALGEIDDKYLNEAIDYHREKRPPFTARKRLLHAACLFLVVLLGGTILLTSNAEVRAAFFGWVRQQHETLYAYFFEGNITISEQTKYELGYVPEGCIFVTSYETAGGETYIYTDETNTLMQFFYISAPNNENLYDDGVDYEKTEVTVNGNTGEIYLDPSGEKTNAVVWSDASGTLFTVSGRFDADTLLKMAESVRKTD